MPTEKKLRDRLYELKREIYPELFENLIITGRHDILVDKNTVTQTGQCTEDFFDKKRYVPMFDSSVTMYDRNGNFTIYDIALESKDPDKFYGIYANGLLTTCMS